MNNKPNFNQYNVASVGAIAIRAERKAHESRKAQQTTIRYIGHDDNSIVFHVIRTVDSRKNDSSYTGFDNASKGDLHFSRVTELRITRGSIEKSVLGIAYVGITAKIATWVSMPVLDNVLKAAMVASALWHGKHMNSSRYGFDMRQTWGKEIKRIFGTNEQKLNENMFDAIESIIDDETPMNPASETVESASKVRKNGKK